jgi:glycosyltransferase involved in cell wall biosynthesis
MRVLFLTKQQYMGKDLLRDRFGRFYEVPKSLALFGHHVRGVCLKYWADGAEPPMSRQCLENVEWESFQLNWNWPAAIARYYQRLKKMVGNFRPEVIVGASDAIHIMMAATLSRNVDAPLVVDLYDDFESYGTARFPGIKKGLQYAVAKASAVSTVSTNLEAKVKQKYRATGTIRTIPNAVCPEIFRPTDKNLARQKLGLSQSGILIGTAGALSAARGINILFEAFEKLSRKERSLSLIVAGQSDRRLSIPASDKVRYLGELPHRDVGHLFNALDVGVICNRRTQFAEYCFPQKFYEMVACRLPLVAADVGVMPRLLARYEHSLYEPENADSLAKAIELQLDHRTVVNGSVPTWRDRGEDFHQLLGEALETSRAVKPYENWQEVKIM